MHKKEKIKGNKTEYQGCRDPISVDPQFCPLTLACISGVSPTPIFVGHDHGALVELNRFLDLTGVHIWLDLVQVWVHYEIPSWPIPWFISCYRLGVRVSTKNSVQLEFAEAHPNQEHSDLF